MTPKSLKSSYLRSTFWHFSLKKILFGYQNGLIFRQLDTMDTKQCQKIVIVVVTSSPFKSNSVLMIKLSRAQNCLMHVT